MAGWTSWMRGIGCGLCLAGASGCIPVALPPVHGRVAGGVDMQGDGLMEWRAGAYPAQLAPSVFRRPWMAGFGYVGRTANNLGIGHGVYAEAGYVRVRRTGEDSARRLAVTLAPELIKRDDFGPWGRGLTLTVAHDWATSTSDAGGGKDRVMLMAAHGEGAVGVQLSMGMEHHAQRTMMFGMVGVRLTVPALFALIFAPEVFLDAAAN